MERYNGSHRPTVEEIRYSLNVNSYVDYTIFFGMIIASSAFGLMYARCTKGTGSGTNEYLFGDKMGVFPISMSLIASVFTSLTIIGTPALVYSNGIGFLYLTIGSTLAGLLCYFIYFPVLLKLKLPSTYEYLHLRFDDRVRWLTSLCFILSMVLKIPINIYVPSMVLSQGMGVDLFQIAVVMSSICIFSTCIGGIRAVVWTDVIQTVLMAGTMLMIMIKGTYDSGGVQNVWNSSYNTNRITFPSLSLDFTTEYSLLSLIFGGTTFSLANDTLNQNCMQRYNTLRTSKQVRRALITYLMGYFFMFFVSGAIGLAAFSFYQECDPLTTRLARNKNEIVPIFVMDLIGHIPGLVGLFYVGVFSASLSTLSTALNSVSAVILEDFIKPLKKTPMSDNTTLTVLKVTVVIFGTLCVALVLLVDRSSSAIMVLAVSLTSITNGPMAGLFTVGMLLPFSNSKGALWGGVSGLLFTGIIVAGNQVAQMNGALRVPQKQLSTINCSYDFTMTLKNLTVSDNTEVFFPFKIFYMWHSFIGFIITLVVACVVSYVTGLNDVRKTDYRYFSKHVYRWLPAEEDNEENLRLNPSTFSKLRN